MIYTKDNIQGIMFKLKGTNSSTVYIIDTDSKFIHIKKPYNPVRGHSIESMIQELNNGHWIPIDKQEVNNNYEIY